MNFSEIFIRRPIATSLLAAALFLAGAAAYFNLPVSPLPRVDFPTIQVSGMLPGASPETMASSVATPLERRFGRIAGVTEITSSSSLGSTSITLQFDLDRDVDAAARDVQAAINAASGELPANLPTRPTYRKINPGDSPIMIIAMTSDTLPLGQVFDAANSIVAQRISQVQGVGQVLVGGGQQPAVRVQVDPQVLAGLGLTLEDVRNLLGQANVNQPKGSLQNGSQAYSLAIDDQITLAAQYKPLILAYNNGSPVRLGDIATVIDSVENNKLSGWVDGKRSIMLIIRRQPGANIIDTIERVRNVLPQLRASISPAIDINIASDRAITIRAAVDDVERTLLLTVGLVILVVFLFLRSASATAIPSVAVPLSLVGTFGVMYLMDYSLDNLSLMALTISTGFVVDDAIVVTENIARYLEQGLKPIDAALQGARQIGFTVISITVSLLAVFIPLLMMGGIIGRLFREFSVVLSIAIAVSALISLTVTPMMCAHFLHHDPKEKHGRLYMVTERFFEGMLHGYERGLRWALAHRGFMLLLTLGTVVMTVVLFIKIPKGLFPQQDTGMIAGFTEAAQDVSFATMRDLQKAGDAIVRADPAVDHVVSFMGAANGSTANTGSLFLALKPWEERDVNADQIINRLRPKLAKIPGFNLFLQSVQDVRVGGRPTRTQYQYTLQDANLDVLNTWGPRILEAFKKLPELKDVASDQQTAGLQASLFIDRDTASRFGITPQLIDDTLYDAYGQRQVSLIFTQLNQYHVVLEASPQLQETPDQLNQLYVAATGKSPTPLNAFTRFEPTPVSLSINHQGQFPSITISFNLAPDVALGQAVTAIRNAQDTIGMPPSMRADFQGTAQAFQASLASQPKLIMAALFTVYIVLGILYESFVHPITILSTIPSAGVGALWALLLFGMDFSVIGLIGIILLIGIVKKNAIMMIDFAIEAQRDENLSKEDAIFKACILRFRPIMMTTMAALLGGLPLALGSGTGSETRKPLGIAIVGGLIISQMLTLFTTPIVYLAMDRLTRRKRTPMKGDMVRA